MNLQQKLLPSPRQKHPDPPLLLRVTYYLLNQFQKVVHEGPGRPRHQQMRLPVMKCQEINQSR